MNLKKNWNEGKIVEGELLRISDLTVEIKDYQSRRNFFALKGLSFSLQSGEIMGLVGESGCGKSMTALSILRILPPNAGFRSGEVLYKGVNLLNLSEKEMRKFRGKEISMVFQEPGSALNPVFTIGYQLTEPLRIHFSLSRKEAKDKAMSILKEVGLTPDVYSAYPHMLSGGMKQRAVIAIAIAGNPSLIIADEPTTALDLTVEAQILELFKKLQRERNLTILFITHNFAIVSEMCTRVAVMYTGRIVEIGKTEEIIKNPLHPYTIALLKSIPRKGEKYLSPIPGVVPPLWDLPEGCPFKDRCPEVFEKCNELPELFNLNGRFVRCWGRI